LRPDTTDDEIARITREAGDGSCPGAVLEFEGGDRDALYEAERRLNGLYWRNRSLAAHVPL
jgi:hypothetical protein